jgi:Rad3-related DNA helicase
MSEYIKNFPYKEIREQQTTAIEFCMEEFKAGKRFVIIEAGTGVGKSAIGYTVAQTMAQMNPIASDDVMVGSWFVTTQKLLQDQYIKDYDLHGMKSIKSSSNYQCRFKKYNTCADSQKELKVEEKGTRFWNSCVMKCVYKEEKEGFLKSKTSVTNFPYLLTESNYAGKISRRQMLVIDEAHNTETELSKFIEVSISDRFCKSVLKQNIPNHNTQLQAFLWIRDVYFPKVVSHLKHIEKMLEKYSGLKSKLKDFVSLSRQLDLTKGHKEKIDTFINVYNKENWVYDYETGYGKASNKITFKPIDVAAFSESMLFRLGEKVLMMSATILDKHAFCKSLGIPIDQASFISLPSPFPIKNRPIFFCPIGKMTQKEIDRSLPKLSNAIKSIMDQHSDEKGIIHAHSYKIAKYIKMNIKSKRILIHDSTNRDEVLKRHLTSKEPTVLLSPSMTEGVDLQEESSRFQIVCKVPYPYLGDKLVKKRMNKWDWWYPLQTAKTIVQSVGRSIRSNEDFAVTYILDENWNYFYSRNKNIFPEDFRKCLR